MCGLAPHPGGRRLLVHTTHPANPLKVRQQIVERILVISDIISQMLDLRTGSVMQTYPDIQNFRPPLASLISPCGTWVAGGSDCGVALLWNTDTGNKRDR